MVTERKTDPGDTYEQSGNFGTGSMNKCEINDNAKVAGEIDEGARNKAEMNPSIVNQIINLIVTSSEKNAYIPKSDSSKQTIDKDGHETPNTPVTFSVVGSIGSEDVKKLKSILRLLRQLSEDITIDIEDIELGSIRLILNGSPEGLERLEALFKSGELTEIEGIPVENVQFVTTKTSKGGEDTQPTERKRLAFTIAGSLDPDDIAKLKAAIIETSNNDEETKIHDKKRKTTIVACEKGVEIAAKALIRLGFDSTIKFANSQLLSRSTVTNFFNQQPIKIESFKRICKALKLNWEEVAGLRTKEGVESVQKITRVVVPVDEQGQ